MALMDVVEKLKDCATQSEKTGGVIILDLTREELTSNDVVCIQEDKLQKEGINMFKGKTIARLSNREVNFILNPGKEHVNKVVVSIIDNHKCIGKELTVKESHSGLGWHCNMSNADMERLDRKR